MSELRDILISIQTDAALLPNSKQNRPMRENILNAASAGLGLVDAEPEPEPPPDPVLVSITVAPTLVTAAPGEQVQFGAIGTYSNGVSKQVAPIWSTTGGAMTTDGNWLGIATPGDYVITATVKELTASTTVTVVSVVPEPEPVPEPVPSGRILFDDNFASGGKSLAQNNCRWAGVNGSVPPTVVPDPTNPSGFSLRFRYNGSTSLGSDAFCEQNYELDPVGFEQLFFYLEWKVPDNYFHRDDPNGPDNNKGLRVWGGKNATDSRDVSYANSSVKAGYSTLAYPQSHSRHGQSQIVVEFGNQDAVGTGNYGTGPWTPWFAKGTIERHCMFVRRGTTNGDATKPGIGGDAILKLWRNGVKVYDRSDLDIYTTGGWNRFVRGYVLGWSNSGFNEQTDLLLRRIVIATDVIPELLATPTP